MRFVAIHQLSFSSHCMNIGIHFIAVHILGMGERGIYHRRGIHNDARIIFTITCYYFGVSMPNS